MFQKEFPDKEIPVFDLEESVPARGADYDPMLNWCTSKKLHDAGILKGRIIIQVLELPGYPSVSAHAWENLRITALDLDQAREYAKGLPPLV